MQITCISSENHRNLIAIKGKQNNALKMYDWM